MRWFALLSVLAVAVVAAAASAGPLRDRIHANRPGWLFPKQYHAPVVPGPVIVESEATPAALGCPCPAPCPCPPVCPCPAPAPKAPGVIYRAMPVGAVVLDPLPDCPGGT